MNINSVMIIDPNLLFRNKDEDKNIAPASKVIQNQIIFTIFNSQDLYICGGSCGN